LTWGFFLEILFLRDTPTGRSELSFRLRVRAARYLETDPQEHYQAFALFSDLYDVRSAAVYNGYVPKKIKGVSVQELLDQRFSLVATALGRFIPSGDLDWHQVTLS
jgi:hypothetical protein